MKEFIPATLLASAITLTFALFSGCGGGSGNSEKTSGFGIGGTGVTAAGQITGFGSIFVNGIRFDTSTADVSLDGSSSSENDLRLGMFVTIDGTLDGTGMGGTARTITFDDDIQGPIATITTDPDGFNKTLDVLGSTVIADSTSTVFDNVTFATLSINDVIEVSGFINGNGNIQATRIEKKENFIPSSSEVELKGTVTGLAGTLFTLGSLTVNFSGADLSDIPGGVVSNGMQVEAKGTLNGSTISATRVEEEDDLFGDSVGKVSLEGIITNYVNDSNFDLSGQNVNASSAQKEPPTLTLANGIKIEVEGPIENGVLVATEVGARSGDIKLEAIVSDVNPVAKTITLFYAGAIDTVTVHVDSKTEIHNENGAITLDVINKSTDYAEVNAHIDGSGNIIANEVSIQSEIDDDILQGPVEDSVSGSSITVLGVTFFTSPTITDFELANDTVTTSSTFYTTLNIGDVVKIEDSKNIRDGIADEVEFED